MSHGRRLSLERIPPASIFAVAGFAIAGQFFLAQSHTPWTLWPGFALMVAAGWVITRWPLAPDSTERSLRWETPLFVLVLLIAALARLWRLSSIPYGLHQDIGFMGICALRILREGWHPWSEIFQLQTPFPLDLYQIAAWFGLAGSSLLSLRLFYILLSLAAFPLMYLFMRRLASPRVALLALFFLAVMRWNWVETRNAHPSAEIPFYLMAMLTLFLYGVKNRKPLFLLGAALVSGLGFYTYQSLKALPLLLWALMAYELLRFPKESKTLRRISGWIVLLPLVLALLYLISGTDLRGLGQRESETFILNKMLAEKSLSPLLSSLSGLALMFNRLGNADPFYNLPGHRLLDDGTGILFLLGLVAAARLWKQREGAYPLIGFGIMALPGCLTSDPIPSQRYAGLEPFVAYFAALGGIGLYDAVAGFAKKNAMIPRVLAALALCGIAGQNAYTYFVLQAGDVRCQAASGPEQTFIGLEILGLEKESPGRFHYYVDPFYFRNPTVRFIADPARDRLARFDLEDWTKAQVPKDKNDLIFLESEKPGILSFLQSRFRGSRTDNYSKPDGQTGLYLFFLDSNRTNWPPPWDRGLKGVYSQASSAKPVAIRVDPLLDFSSRQDFPFTDPPPYSILWTGTLEVPVAGSYEFQVLTLDRARLWLDNKEIPLEKPVLLAEGSHALRLDFEKESGYYMSLHLVWKKPGGANWQVVPAGAFGQTPFGRSF